MNSFVKIICVIAIIGSSFCQAETPIIFCEEDTETCQQDAAMQLRKNFPQHFDFVDERLLIKSADKTRKIHLNQPLTFESEDEKTITLDRYFPKLNWLVVREVYDGGESIGYQIIDIKHRLKTTDIASQPIISNNETHFINYGIDLEAGFTLNGLVIYKIENQGEIKEVFRHDDSWGVDSAEWINPTIISVTIRDYCNPEERDELCDKKFILENKNDAWQLSPL
jgi:hypothetical protein